MDTKFISQSHVLLDDGFAHCLKYYLTANDTLESGAKYGIMIEEYARESIAAEIRYISEDKDRVAKLVELFAGGQVFPYSLDETLDAYMDDM